MDSIIRFSVSLPERLLDTLDEKIITKGYSSRSEFVRDLIRDQIAQDRWQEEDSEVYANLTIIFDHHHKDLANRMLNVQHNAEVVILCNTHVHLDHHNCMESIILKGTPKTIEQFAIELGGLKGVRFSKLARATKFEA